MRCGAGVTAAAKGLAALCGHRDPAVVVLGQGACKVILDDLMGALGVSGVMIDVSSLPCGIDNARERAGCDLPLAAGIGAGGVTIIGSAE